MAKKLKPAEEIKVLLDNFEKQITEISCPEEQLTMKLECIDSLIVLHQKALHEAIGTRLKEMESDGNEHFIIYKVLGIDDSDHKLIDVYQNIGRFVYKYAGALIENITKVALGGKRLYFENTISSRPKKFEIDCYTSNDNRAHEIKWRDATTDGDHKNKENNKVKGIIKEGYIPVRIMFFMPEREQARNIQEKIIESYSENGYAYVG